MGDIGNRITEPGEPLGLTRPDRSALPGSQTTNPAPSPAETRMEGRRGARGLGQSVRSPRLRVGGRTDFSSAELGVRGSGFGPAVSAVLGDNQQTLSARPDSRLAPRFPDEGKRGSARCLEHSLSRSNLREGSVGSADRTPAEGAAPRGLRGLVPSRPLPLGRERAQGPLRSRWDVLREAAKVPAATFPRENVRIL